jgi:hypothetical protein
MDDLLTIEEIEARFAPEWVLIAEPQTDEDLQLRAGRILFHSPVQDEVCKATEFPPGRHALRFLGTIPEDLDRVQKTTGSFVQTLAGLTTTIPGPKAAKRVK